MNKLLLGIPYLLVITGISLLLLSCQKESQASQTSNTPPIDIQKLVQTDITILFLGDSLTEGYNLNPTESYPSQIEKHFHESGRAINLINAGISGDTTLGGLTRFEWYLDNQTYDIDILFLALGANDGLRGLSVTNTRQNLKSIIKLAEKSKIKVVLAGMQVPPNYGEAYALEFREMYDKLEKEFSLVRMDFLLNEVAGERSLNLDDGIHPNAEGYKIIAANVYKLIDPLVVSLIQSRL